jgi:hypothetical protein
MSPTLLSARVLLLELSQVVDIVIDNNVEVVGLVVRRNVVGCEGFRHFALWNSWSRSVFECGKFKEWKRETWAYKCLGSRSLTRDHADM